MGKRKGQEPQVNSTLKTLLAYFAFTAVIHKRFLCPGQGLDPDEIAEEYALDLITGNPGQNKFPELSAALNMLPKITSGRGGDSHV